MIFLFKTFIFLIWSNYIFIFIFVYYDMITQQIDEEYYVLDIIKTDNIPNTIKLSNKEIKTYDKLFLKNKYIKNKKSSYFDLLKLSLYVKYKLKLDIFIPAFPNIDNHTFHLNICHMETKYDWFDKNNKFVKSTTVCHYFICYNSDAFDFNINNIKKKNRLLIRALGGLCHEVGHYIYEKRFGDDTIEYKTAETCSSICGGILGCVTGLIIIIVMEFDASDYMIYLIYIAILCLILLMFGSYYLKCYRKQEIFCDYYAVKSFPTIHKIMSKHYKSKTFIDSLIWFISTHPTNKFRSEYFNDVSIIENKYPDIVEQHNSL